MTRKPDDATATAIRELANAILKASENIARAIRDANDALPNTLDEFAVTIASAIERAAEV